MNRTKWTQENIRDIYKGSVFDEGVLKSKIRSDYERDSRRCENAFKGEERIFKLQCLKKQFHKKLAHFELIDRLIGDYVLKSPLSLGQLNDSRHGYNMDRKAYNKFLMKPIYERIVVKRGFFKRKRELERLSEFGIDYMTISMERDCVFLFRLRDNYNITYLSYKLGNRIVLLKPSDFFTVDVSKKEPRIIKTSVN